MTTLLHIAGSPRGSASESRALAGLFLETYADEHPDVTIEEWDIWDGSVPEFGAAAAEGKMNTFAGIDLEGPSVAAWREVTATFERFAAADRYLFSVPMWNASVPYKLKQLIDVVSQPGLVFSFDPVEGYTGLLPGRKAAVLYTAAIYGPGAVPAGLARVGRRPGRLAGVLPAQHRHRGRRRHAGRGPAGDPPAGEGLLSVLGDVESRRRPGAPGRGEPKNHAEQAANTHQPPFERGLRFLACSPHPRWVDPASMEGQRSAREVAHGPGGRAQGVRLGTGCRALPGGVPADG
jgi:FMN-dependent NADH-azoreductase